MSLVLMIPIMLCRKSMIFLFCFHVLALFFLLYYAHPLILDPTDSILDIDEGSERLDLLKDIGGMQVCEGGQLKSLKIMQDRQVLLEFTFCVLFSTTLGIVPD